MLGERKPPLASYTRCFHAPCAVAREAWTLELLPSRYSRSLERVEVEIVISARQIMDRLAVPLTEAG